MSEAEDTYKVMVEQAAGIIAGSQKKVGISQATSEKRVQGQLQNPGQGTTKVSPPIIGNVHLAGIWVMLALRYWR